MAISMSAGGSGYTRSDFMISDAAIPLRVEESMEQDNSGQFSKVLSGIGEAKKAVSAESTVAQESVPKDIPEDIQDIHALVEAVVNGEIKPEDIPEELLPQGVFEELTKLVEAAVSPEDKEEPTDIGKDPASQEILAELTAMLSVQQTVVTPDYKTEELSVLTAQPEIEAVQTVEVQAVTEQTAVIPQETFQMADAVQIAETSSEPVTEFIAAQEAPVNTAQTEPIVKHERNVKRESDVKSEKPLQTADERPVTDTAESTAVQQTSAKNGENAEQQKGNTDSGRKPDAEAAQKPEETKTSETKPVETKPAEFGRIREDISHAEVKSVRKAPETVQPKQTEQPAAQEQTFTQPTAQRSRVIPKSDELEMIRNSTDVKPADENAVQNMIQPQVVTDDRPVLFTRADGGEVPVKPSDVAKQVADKLVERTESLKDGDVEYSVTLNPEELGKITVRMTKTADGAVSVSIAAENSRTLKIIEDNGSAIQDTLKQNGVQLEDWQIVGESKQETHAEDYQGSSKNPYRESENDRGENEPDGESFAEIIASM